jgi:hypothetical protein
MTSQHRALLLNVGMSSVSRRLIFADGRLLSGACPVVNVRPKHDIERSVHVTSRTLD